MRDILDRGLGSEDRKTLRKLASVGPLLCIRAIRADFAFCTLMFSLPIVEATQGARDAEAEAAQAGFV